ncbi:HTH-type transcriptional regulator YidZ [Sinobacterium norvegicum]|uniref:HTH-type transcriptional regulator YidZ n=1 Tax=Sinobacterium norvegicum TaxID=1641715 RepID=A0ABM9AC06_9GAMM|nr:LysR family transcriptional regulator [Sinobacterium norvegicum]CAH0990723.1 HTH-type transcriptional regulator YidZ [Sinobacterium norvegicum]
MKKNNKTKDLFTSLDLNLLRVFLILSQELNTRKTAERLHVSQPAISRSLQKLRNHFGDELFVKSLNGMKPTGKGEQLMQTLPPILNSLSDIVNYHNDFNPSELTGTLKIAIHPLLSIAMANTLFEEIQKQAPKLCVNFLSWNNQTPELLMKNEATCGINYFPIDISKEIIQKPVGNDNFCIYVAEDHPLKGPYISPQDFINYPLATIIIPGWNQAYPLAEVVLSRYGITPTIKLRTEVPKVAFDILAHSDLLLPASSLISPEDTKGLRKLKISKEINMEDIPSQFAVFYHYRNRQNPYHLWLTKLIENELRTLEQGA